MKYVPLCAVFVMGLVSDVRAADPLSGTWTTGPGAAARTYVFKAAGDRFTGIVCGPCDNPDSVFEIEDGQALEGNRALFFIRHDGGGPGRAQAGASRERVEASIAGNTLRLSARSESDPSASPVATTVTRVVQDFELDPRPLPSQAIPPGAPANGPSFEGRWVSVGRTAQQNWILRFRGSRLWGLVCGPCTPAVVAMLDGYAVGDTITFNINHIDTPPDPARRGIQRNIMTGTIGRSENGNVMRFTWVSEGAPDRTGEIVMIGPVR